MDSVPVEKSLDGQATEDALKQPLILRIIFEHLGNRDLRKLVFMSKRWSYEARSVLRERNNPIWHLPESHPCIGLWDRAQEIRGFNFIPFNGISIVLDAGMHGAQCTRENDADVQQLYINCIDNVPLKHLGLKLRGSWLDFTDCPAFLLYKRALERFGPHLDQLSIQVDLNRLEFIEEALQNTTFQRLSCIHLGENSLMDPSISLIRALVARASNLKMIKSLTPLNLAQDFLERGSTIVVVANFPVNPIENPIGPSMLHAIRCDKIKLEGCPGDVIMERLTTTTRMLLLSSSASLRSMEVEATFLVALMSFDISLENVVDLTITFDISLFPLYPFTFNVIRGFNFSRLCPRLSHVNGKASTNPNADRWSSEMDRELAPALLPAQEPDRAVNILSVSLAQTIQPSAAELLAQMTPLAQTITIVSDGDHFPFDLLWGNFWPNIIHIKVETFGRSSRGTLMNLDHFICGIHPAEVAEYQNWTDLELRSLKLVRKPSILCVNGLSTFSLFYGRSNGMFFGAADNPTTVFSKVSCLLAFERRPGLTINLETDDDGLLQALSHLSPPAQITFTQQLNHDDGPDEDDDQDHDE